MPKRYRQWLFDPNTPKPRTTQFRHSKQAESSRQGHDAGEHAEAPEDDRGPDHVAPSDDPVPSTSSGSRGGSTGDVYIAPGEDQSTEAERVVIASSDTSDSESTGISESGSEATRSQLDEDLYPGSRITKGESLLLILGHSLRHSCTKEATESLLELLEAHLPNEAALPTSKYMFFKQFLSSHRTMMYNFYCPNCLQYLGDKNDSEFYCDTCSRDFDINVLTENCSYFLSFDISEQIRDKLSQTELNFKQLSRSRSYDVGEITTSQGYSNLPIAGNDLSVTWNTDGVPLYESSGYSIWPLVLQINELPHVVRVYGDDFELFLDYTPDTVLNDKSRILVTHQEKDESRTPVSFQRPATRMNEVALDPHAMTSTEICDDTPQATSYALPKFPADIQLSLKAWQDKVIQSLLRTRIVSWIYHDLCRYGLYPQKLYSEAARQLVLRDHRLRDAVAGYDAEVVTEDAHSVEYHKAQTIKELQKSVPDNAKVEDAMSRTFGSRRMWTESEKPSAASILKTYPALCLGKHVCMRITIECL
ncbi:uncharacterized protein LOC135384795 [Ornithodoros turicata]|uniref:uncharacterized protein LOC135384795 n=1 Tax=Ornithodoros turicata TaxID=34597 RepID=UPI003139F2DB